MKSSLIELATLANAGAYLATGTGKRDPESRALYTEFLEKTRAMGVERELVKVYDDLDGSEYELSFSELPNMGNLSARSAVLFLLDVATEQWISTDSIIREVANADERGAKEWFPRYRQ